VSLFHLEPLHAVILWGGIYPGVKLGLRDIPLLSFTYLRILLAMLVLFAVSQRRHAVSLPRALWVPLLRAGLAQTVFQYLLVASLQWTTAGTSAILLATAPLLTAGWCAGTGRAQLGQLQWYGVGLGFVGVSLVVHGGAPGLSWAHFSGNLLALGAAGAWAWYGMVIGPLVGTLGPTRATGWTMVVAALCFTPLALSEVQRHTWGNVSWEAWIGLVYGATAGMVVAMALWGKAIQRLGPIQTMVYVYLEPVSAVLLAASVLGESLHPIQAVGAALTFVGVGLASSR
jgi:drug/metabolite transporter (DMT)-like permease